MAFDAVTVAALKKELSDTFQNTRIYKISEPDQNELMLTIKGNSSQYRLLISADASLPLMYLTDDNKPAPLTAPNFCMLLRKHLQNAKIISVTQPGLERIIRITLEHLDEMGDLCRKHLIVELMGKHSNIIFTDDKDIIIDSIKHVSHNVSSVREVLPGREYFIPKTQDKVDPLNVEKAQFFSIIAGAHAPVSKALYMNFTGLSPILGTEICYRAEVDGDASTSSLSDTETEALYKEFSAVMTAVKEGAFKPESSTTAPFPLNTQPFL